MKLTPRHSSLFSRRAPARRRVAAQIGTLLLVGVAPAWLALHATDRAGKPAPPASHPGMVLIPGGWFTMGSSGLGEADGPPHSVQLDPFFLDRHEVTFARFAAFVRRTGYRAEGNWRDRYDTRSADLPVVGVTWNDAVACCRAEGKHLPTEAEWERGAQGPQGLRYAYGDTYRPTAANADSLGARPVGSFAPNGFGMHDTSGNVEEWCADWFDNRYYRVAPLRNPRGPGAGDFRVARGGSWSNFQFSPFPSRADARAFHAPDYRSPALGFRCASSAARR